MKKTVIELFAGVGGFRVGLNNVKLNNGKVEESNDWDFVWSNQWEPSTKAQPAFNCYVQRFGESVNNINEDIVNINVNDIPKHNLLVGGFPCQDYSVARPLSKEKGIHGKKGVLWWEIHRIIKYYKTPFLLLENVDRLLKSPANQRGRDFGIMLKSLSDLGYGVEWRVINAADYSGAQRRRRVFIFAYHKSTYYYKTIIDLSDTIYKKGLFANLFKVESLPNKKRVTEFNLPNDNLYEYTESFKNVFYNSGVMVKGKVLSIDTISCKEEIVPIKTILEKRVSDKLFYFTAEQIKKHKYLKDSKSIPRKTPNGDLYYYTEGSMSFPENLNLPGRTMLTSEGTINRSSHVIKDLKTNKLRKITPVEAERLNGFSDNWTDTGMTIRQRYFMMGNALVVPMIKRIETGLNTIFDNEK